MVYFIKFDRKGEDVLALVQTGNKSLIPNHLDTIPTLAANKNSIVVLKELKDVSLEEDVVVLSKINYEKEEKTNV